MQRWEELAKARDEGLAEGRSEDLPRVAAKDSVRDLPGVVAKAGS